VAFKVTIASDISSPNKVLSLIMQKVLNKALMCRELFLKRSVDEGYTVAGIFFDFIIEKG